MGENQETPDDHADNRRVVKLTLFQSLFLGLLQGFTEFLPLSSSGHLAMAQLFLKLRQPPVFLDTMLHLGTLLAVIIYFRVDIIDIIKSLIGIDITAKDRSEYKKLALYLFVASLPAAAAGFLLEGLVEQTFTSLPFVGAMLIVTGAILWFSDAINNKNNDFSHISISDSIWVGLVQAASLLPGLSRSGTTITACLWRGMDRDIAARFSFLLSIPVILGAGGLSLFKAWGDSSNNFSLVFIASVTAFLSGLLAINILLYLLKRQRFRIFSVYCFIVGFLTIIVYFL